MDKADLLQKVKDNAFMENNWQVLNAINLMHEKFIRLSLICAALKSDISKADISKSVNFLEDEGYIKVRKVSDKQISSVSDFAIEELEAKLSGRGIRLMCGDITDTAIKMQED